MTETSAAVNSTLDLEEVLGLVASKVADALEADACFVYLYDEQAGELVLRATHGTRVEEMTRTPRMRPGEGITGSAASDRAPIMIPEQAHLDERFKAFPNLPEDQYESILAVPILSSRPWPASAPAGQSPAPPPPDAAGGTVLSGPVLGGTVPSGPAPPAAPQEHEEITTRLQGAMNVRTEEPREFSDAEIDLLVAIAAQVAQTIEHAKLYADAQVPGLRARGAREDL